jgi:hypothetical protein
VEIGWEKGVDAERMLESLGERQIARLRFVSNDGKAKFECNVASSAESRRLSIRASSFEMDAGWRHYWSKPKKAAGEG